MRAIKKLTIWIVKILTAAVAFAIIFSMLNIVFAPKYIGESTSAVDGLTAMEKNSVDYIFLGPSQMFCGINAQKLTEEYDLPSYCYGASSQLLPTTVYYLQEALKKQRPKIVFVEISQIYYTVEDFDEGPLAWSYYPQRLSRNKICSLYALSDSDLQTMIKYCFPVLAYTSEWRQFKIIESIDYILSNKSNPSRGYLAREGVEPVEILYLNDYEAKEKQIPQSNIKAILDINDLCEENGINLILLKVPVSDWSREDSKVVKSFSSEKSLTFVDMNDYLDEIEINGETDFFNKDHLNSQGAEKTTAFLARYILSRGENNSNSVFR